MLWRRISTRTQATPDQAPVWRDRHNTVKEVVGCMSAATIPEDRALDEERPSYAFKKRWTHR